MIIDQFKSRYGQIRIITEQPDGSFIIEGPTLYHRCGTDENGNGLWMVDFEGGPFIAVGDKLLGSKDYGIVKTLEIIEDDKKEYLKVKVICN